MSHDPPFSTYDDYKQERLHDTPPAEKERMQLEHRIREHLATAMSPDNLTSTREKYEQALALLREVVDVLPPPPLSMDVLLAELHRSPGDMP